MAKSSIYGTILNVWTVKDRTITKHTLFPRVETPSSEAQPGECGIPGGVRHLTYLETSRVRKHGECFSMKRQEKKEHPLNTTAVLSIRTFLWGASQASYVCCVLHTCCRWYQLNKCFWGPIEKTLHPMYYKSWLLVSGNSIMFLRHEEESSLTPAKHTYTKHIAFYDTVITLYHRQHSQGHTGPTTLSPNVF